MEVRGEIGATCFVKATVKVIEIGENGTTYLVSLQEGGDFHEIKAEDILFETDAAAILAETSRRLEEIKEDLEEDPLEDIDAGKYGIPETEPKRGRGRPKKATVEGLMAKAEQARIRREAEEDPLWVENDT